MLFDYKATREFIEQAVPVYVKSAPQVYSYLNDLYERLEEKADTVAVTEIVTISKLLENDEWEHPQWATNRIYHMLERLGRDTTGHIGY